eukprot:GHRQ01017913.1.p1 GENE.GHRQ01017913.1~~GHRQ01017913.1.p1  ORF type:complete len:252 (+),score=90.48 GHRQ01017913.1:801-1556(+)
MGLTGAVGVVANSSTQQSQYLCTSSSCLRAYGSLTVFGDLCFDSSRLPLPVRPLPPPPAQSAAIICFCLHICLHISLHSQQPTYAARACALLPPLHSQQPTYDMDPAALEKRYKLLQWQLHPDKSAGKTPEERQYSAEQATLINQAYGVLRNPLSRANYMLMQAGVSEEESEHTITDPDLLMEVMEAREQVEQENDQEQLLKLHNANKQRQTALCKELGSAFACGDIAGARQLVAQLSYWVRLEEAIADKL